jgi:Na+-driven multidrug efflux pump
METTALKLKVEITNKQILQIALPIAASIFVPQVNFITNNIFLSGLGEKQLGVAGITGVYYLVFAVLGFGLNNGLQSLISRRAGENRINEIGNLFQQGVFISIALAAFSTLLTFFISPYILKLSLHNEEHLSIALHFLYLRIWG